jgi:hypothetical protein
MPGFPLTLATSCSCFHQARAPIAPSQAAVLILGQAAATVDNQISVVGCLFTVPGPKSQPCVLIRWAQTSTKVLVQGKPLLLMPPPGAGIGPGSCQSAEQLPQGPPTVKTNQMKVFVT